MCCVSPRALVGFDKFSAILGYSCQKRNSRIKAKKVYRRVYKVSHAVSMPIVCEKNEITATAGVQEEVVTVQALVMPDVVAGMTPDVVVGVMGGVTPDVVVGVAADVIPDVMPDVVADVMYDVMPDVVVSEIPVAEEVVQSALDPAIEAVVDSIVVRVLEEVTSCSGTASVDLPVEKTVSVSVVEMVPMPMVQTEVVPVVETAVAPIVKTEAVVGAVVAETAVKTAMTQTNDTVVCVEGGPVVGAGASSEDKLNDDVVDLRKRRDSPTSSEDEADKKSRK